MYLIIRKSLSTSDWVYDARVDTLERGKSTASGFMERRPNVLYLILNVSTKEVFDVNGNLYGDYDSLKK